MVVQRTLPEDSSALAWLHSAWLLKLRRRTTTYSLITATIVLFMGALFAFELFEDDLTTFEYVLAALLLVASLVIAASVFWGGRRFPLWVGVAVIVVHALVSVYYIGFSDERQNAIVSLQQLPLMAMYCAWFYGAAPSRITMGAIIVAVSVAVSLGQFGGSHGLLGPTNITGLILFSWLCLEMGLFVRHRMTVEVNTDPLTGALNRRGFFERAAVEMRRSQRARHSMAVALLDLDEFKAVNDDAGHAAGDDVLKSLVAQWISLSRSRDALGRLGGDEFIMLLPEIGAEEAAKKMQRMREIAIHPWSWGVADMQPGDTIDDAIHRADQAMYAQKRAG